MLYLNGQDGVQRLGGKFYNTPIAKAAKFFNYMVGDYCKLNNVNDPFMLTNLTKYKNVKLKGR